MSSSLVDNDLNASYRQHTELRLVTYVKNFAYVEKFTFFVKDLSLAFLWMLSKAARDVAEAPVQESDAYFMILQTCDLCTYSPRTLQFIADLFKRTRPRPTLLYNV